MKISIKLFLFCLLLSCSSNISKFKLCAGKKRPYYYPTLEYKGDFYEIKRHFLNNYKTVQLPNNNGIVKIIFHINCKGETGNFSIDTYSLDYKKIPINKEIIKQLLYLAKGLKDWIPARNEEGENINSHKFFAFNIIKGDLIDILPK
jgi:hypothetical protein